MDESIFVSMVCSSTSQPAVIRFRWNGESFDALGASKQRPGSIVPPNGNGPVRAPFTVGAGYSGCAYCGADNFVRCGRCKELSCYDNSWEVFTCPRCGNSGRITGTIDSLSGMGDS